MTSGSMEESRAQEPPASLLYNYYTGCHFIFTFLHSAVTGTCVFTCGESWLHNCIPLCAWTRQARTGPQVFLDALNFEAVHVVPTTMSIHSLTDSVSSYLPPAEVGSLALIFFKATIRSPVALYPSRGRRLTGRVTCKVVGMTSAHGFSDARFIFLIALSQWLGSKFQLTIGKETGLHQSKSHKNTLRTGPTLKPFFCNLISKVTFHQFFMFYSLVTSPNSHWKSRSYTSIRIPGLREPWEI